MKIMFGMVAVIGILLAMILGIGHIDGLTLGEPSDETATVGTSAEREPGPATGEEEAYLNFVIGYIVGVGNAINQVGALLEVQPEDEATWHLQMAMLLSKIRSSKDAITGVVPPPALEEFHLAGVRVLEHCSTFAVLMGETIDAGEMQLSEEAKAELLLADQVFAEVDRLLTAFLLEHPLPQPE